MKTLTNSFIYLFAKELSQLKAYVTFLIWSVCMFIVLREKETQNKTKMCWQQKVQKTLWFLLMDGVQLSQGYRATTKRQFMFNHSIPKIPWYSSDRPRKDERQSWSLSHPVVLNNVICQKDVQYFRKKRHLRWTSF